MMRIAILCLFVSQAFAHRGWGGNGGWGGLGYNGYGGGFGGYGGGGYGSSNANALGGGSALFGNVGTNNVAYTNSNPWGSSGLASNSGWGSGYGVNVYGAAMSNSNYGNGYFD